MCTVCSASCNTASSCHTVTSDRNEYTLFRVTVHFVASLQELNLLYHRAEVLISAENRDKPRRSAHETLRRSPRVLPHTSPDSGEPFALLGWSTAPRHRGDSEQKSLSVLDDRQGGSLLPPPADVERLRWALELVDGPGRTIPLNSSSSENSLRKSTAASSKIDSFSSPTGLCRSSSSRLNSNIQTGAVGSSNFPRNCLALTRRSWKASTETP